MTLTEHVHRYVDLKRKLGYEFTANASMLMLYAVFAEARHDRFTRTETIVDWASNSKSLRSSCKKLQVVRAFAIWMHAENTHHEVPPPDFFGPLSRSRPPPHLMSVDDIRTILSAALLLGPVGTITPHTWHYLFGLMAVTGIRVSEATSLLVSDITPDGLLIRDTKFRMSRLLPLHPTTMCGLDAYRRIRHDKVTLDNHLFVLSHGRSPHKITASRVFRELACKTGVRAGDVASGPRLHDLRHSFAVRSLENLGDGNDPGRHMLALSTYLGHAEITDTYWYLGACRV